MEKRIELIKAAHDAVFEVMEEIAEADEETRDKIFAFAEEVADLGGAIEDFYTEYRKYF